MRRRRNQLWTRDIHLSSGRWVHCWWEPRHPEHWLDCSIMPGDRFESAAGVLHTEERLEDGERWELKQRFSEFLPVLLPVHQSEQRS